VRSIALAAAFAATAAPAAVLAFVNARPSALYAETHRLAAPNVMLAPTVAELAPVIIKDIVPAVPKPRFVRPPTPCVTEYLGNDQTLVQGSGSVRVSRENCSASRTIEAWTPPPPKTDQRANRGTPPLWRRAPQ
jgi:hypothetical protein